MPQTATPETAITETRMLVGGAFVAGGDQAETVLNPRSGETLLKLPDATPEQVDAAVGAARAAFEGWRQTTPGQRAGRLLALADAIEAHAEDFVAGRIADASRIAQQRARGAVIVAPYDAELFGHWWYEGPAFLDRVVRKVAGRRGLQLATPTDVIDGDELEALAAVDDVRRRRALTQAARELLLASASDWPFILTHRTVVSYAEQRVRDHLARFDRLHDALASDRIDLELLESLESEDAAFRDLDPRDFCS